MAEHNDKVRNHVQAARDWLGKAERSLDQQNEFKSNLNLMLAQAELQRAKETDCRGVAWASLPVLLMRSVAIIVVAGLIVVIGFNGFNVNKEKVPLLDNVSDNRIESPASPPAQVPVQQEPERVKEEAVVEKNRPEVSPMPTVVEPEVSVPRDQPASVGKPEEKAAVSAEEMQQLMRSAGKSLRGQS